MSKYTMELRELFTPIKFNPPIYSREEVENFFKDYELSDFLTTSSTLGVLRITVLAIDSGLVLKLFTVPAEIR